MWRYLAGAAAALAMIAAGVLLFSGRGRSDPLLPARPPAATASGEATVPASLADVPAASPATREEKRFGRYDKDRNGAVTRDEYLAQRRRAFAKLDANHDGTLSFDEWASKAAAKFATADRDRSGAMSPAEFATTAVKRKPRAPCAPSAPARDEEG